MRPHSADRADRLTAHEVTVMGSMQPIERDRSPWGRVGFVSAVVWALVGLGLAYLWAQSGHPRESGFVALWTGPVLFVLVGRHYKLHGRGSWLRAAVLTIGLVWIAGSVAIFFYAMAAYG